MTPAETNLDKKRIGKLVETLAAFPKLNPNPILETDFSGTITFSNKAATKTLEELGLSDLADFLPEDLGGIIDTARHGSGALGEGAPVYPEALHAGCPGPEGAPGA